MARYRVMVPDVFLNVVADNEEDAIAIAWRRMTETPVEDVGLVAWEDEVKADRRGVEETTGLSKEQSDG